jgi:hypothetical protein
MPESRDQHLTADVRRALKYNAHVTPAQQQAAKERLLRRAAAQMPLEPVAPQRYSMLRAHAQTLRQHASTVINFLFVESSAYERARRLPFYYHHRHYNVHGRYAFAIIRMSA